MTSQTTHSSFSKECWYFVRDGQKFMRKEETSDTIKMKASAKLDKDLQEALTGEDGLMRCGALPQVSVASAAGNKSLLEAIDKARAIHSTRVYVVGIGGKILYMTQRPPTGIWVNKFMALTGPPNL